MASPEDPNPRRSVNMKISDDVVKGTYSNLAIITHTREEFAIDFAIALPPQTVVGARVILSPAHAKRLSAALMDNIRQFEEAHGVITDAPPPGPAAPPSFVN
ncbi:MAG: DUF3467 domain-containing protein [Candidatus Schekmanbacteria bacterium]|nr:DUF3467 domain-containing protein [Candidatus Schekmanbacteria bacterium]